MRVGVLGLGHMGSRVAKKLLEAGHEVHVWDRDADVALRTAGEGAVAADSPTALATRVEALFSVLADDDAVRSVVLDSGLLASLPPGATFADLSTISPELAVELAQAAGEAGVGVLDVEMSGSTPQVESGELALLVGGEADVLERMRPLLEALSKSIWHLGDFGAGAKMKLVVNTMLGIGMQALAEAIALGEAVGLDRERMLEALEQMAVLAPAHKPKVENARRDAYPIAFPLRLMHKDFALVLHEAREAGLELPATTASAEACAAALEASEEDVDFSYVIRTAGRRVADRGSPNRL